MSISDRPWSPYVLVFEEEIKVEPLSTDERRWIESLARLMKRMPGRLSLLECANALLVVDRKAGERSDLADGAARRDGVVLASVASATGKVQSCSG
jgi:hypothetical protein